MLAHGKTDEQGVAAHGTTPLRALAVRDVRATGRCCVERLERPFLVASGAVPGQMHHPDDLLVAVQHRTCRVEGADADSGMATI
jgi:hypothetical protein